MMTSPHAAHAIYDVLIVGAGVAGTVMAITLARQGRQVLLLERDLREPDRIVGELLQPGGVAALHRLGLGECLDEIDALPLRGYRLYYFGEETTFWYPPAARYSVWGSEKTTTVTGRDKQHEDNLHGLKHEGRGFRNGRLVSRLRGMAFAEENVRIIEASAKQFLWSEDRQTVVGVTSRSRTAEATQIDHHFAHLTVISDGQASTFRSMLTDKKPITRSRFYALKLNTDLGSDGLSLGVIGMGWPTGTYQIGPKETRILIDVPEGTGKPSEDGMIGHIRTDVIPTLPSRLHSAADKALTEDRLRSMPNSWLPPCQIRKRGVVLLGDAYNIRHPVSGSGMTVALNDAVVLSELLHPAHVPSLKDYTAVKRQVSEFRHRRKSYSLVLNILAQVMYLLVTADDDYWRIFQRGFVAYACSDEGRTEELAALMGGLLPSPLRLFYHLAAVAMFSIRLHMRKQYMMSPWGVPTAVIQCLVACVKVALVSLPYVLQEALA
ncbi:SE-domain-containing protein [Xylaria sp. FL1777]|nr:SE-domain-containing protein [Xylaria sp. FL1777]